MPGRGMGWYHAKQILDGEVPSAVLTDIVEPWFLGGGADGPGGKEFAAFKKEHEGSVRFHASIKDMPKPDGKMMAMVCTRTADMPGYVADLTDHGVSHVFLEKPGAPTVEELGKMKDECAAKGATIWMGFNKNVTKYVTKGREALASEDRTALHVALEATPPLEAMVALLLAHAADPNARDLERFTPLHLALGTEELEQQLDLAEVTRGW